MKRKINSQQTVLVTGGTGFVGSHLVEALVQSGARVITTSLSANPYSYFYTKKLQEKCMVVPVNIARFDELFAAVTKYEVTFIYHLAAQPLVETAFYNPAETLSSNIMGTVNVLECARLYPKITGVIAASSDKAYGKLNGKKKYVETDRLAGDHPYEVSKSSSDLICTSYVKTYNIPVIITRFGNIYGEGDLNFSRIVPGILYAAATDTVLQLRSDGSFVRDYIYVKDVAEGYILLSQDVENYKGEAFNFGSDDTMSVLDMLHLAKKVLGKNIDHTILNSAKNEIPYQSLDYSKIRKNIGWKPKTRLKDILPELFAWYKTHLQS